MIGERLYEPARGNPGFTQLRCDSATMHQTSRAFARTIAATCAAVVALLVPIGCSERTPTAPSPKQISTLVVVSAPTGQSGLVSRVSRDLSRVASSETAAGDERMVYVSMPPGSVAGGEKATVRNLATTQALTVTMVDGGFDPTPLAATVGDTLEVDVSLPSGREPYFAVVPKRRPPSVVRTNPPKGKTDVPLNTQIIIVFSDPVDPATLSGAVQLLDGSTVVPGSVTPSTSDLIATFTPASPLATNTFYQLVIDTTLRNSRGEAPDSAVHVPFSTGASTTSAPVTRAIVFQSSLGIEAINPDGSGRRVLIADRTAL